MKLVIKVVENFSQVISITERNNIDLKFLPFPKDPHFQFPTNRALSKINTSLQTYIRIKQLTTHLYLI